jgi:hypothetical protein
LGQTRTLTLPGFDARCRADFFFDLLELASTGKNTLFEALLLTGIIISGNLRG